MFSFALNYWPRLLNKEKKHFTKKKEERRGGKAEEEKMQEDIEAEPREMLNLFAEEASGPFVCL